MKVSLLIFLVAFTVFRIASAAEQNTTHDSQSNQATRGQVEEVQESDVVESPDIAVELEAALNELTSWKTGELPARPVGELDSNE